MSSAQRRLTWVLAFCAGFAILLLGRAGWIQLGAQPRLESLAKRQFQTKILIQPKRGAIVDRNGEPLAVNQDSQSLAARPGKIRATQSRVLQLAHALQIPYAKLKQRLDAKKDFVWMKRHLSARDVLRLKEVGLMDAEGHLLEGLWLVRESQRVYPHGHLAAPVIGEVNVDSQGVEGVEYWKDAELRGTRATFEAVKDGFGRPTFLDTEASENVRDGSTVSLTLDASLQFSIEEELRVHLKRHSARSASALVLDATTGEILTMAVVTHDAGRPGPRLGNRLLTDGFEPGSTLKPFLMASALVQGMKSSDKIWGELGQMWVQGRRISEAEAHEKFEWLTLPQIIQRSSNVASAKLALKLGETQYRSTLEQFGFGTRTQLGFPGEFGGKWPAARPWPPLTLANVGFGQGLMVTRLQLAQAYSVFLNGGWLVQPSILRGTTRASNLAPRRVISESIAHEVLLALESVTHPPGTGLKAVPEGFRVAGKTGTAQMVDSETGKYSKHRYTSTFVGYALGVEPKLTILASIEEPRGQYYAAEVAAPLFKDILSAVASRYSMPAKLPLAERVKETPIVTRAAHPLAGNANTGALAGSGKMPDLSGLTGRQALEVLSPQNFEIEMRGFGVVHTQSPGAGEKLVEGARIKLILGLQ